MRIALDFYKELTYYLFIHDLKIAVLYCMTKVFYQKNNDISQTRITYISPTGRDERNIK